MDYFGVLGKIGEGIKGLQLLYDLVIGLMGTDPEPFEGVIFQDSQGAPAEAYANRVHGKTVAYGDFLETKAWMPWIMEPNTVERLGFDLYPLRQFFEKFPELAVGFGFHLSLGNGRSPSFSSSSFSSATILSRKRWD